MKHYLLSFLIFIALIAGVIFFIVDGLTQNETLLTWGIFFYFSFLTILFHYGIVRTTKSRPQVFVRFFLGATTIKLLLHLGIILVFSIFNRDLAIRFIFTFMIMYVLFTVFEVMSVWRRAKS